jgi:hypothetical protein
MTILSFSSPPVGQYAGQTRIIPMAVSDNLAAVLASGYLNGQKDVNGNPILVAVNGVNLNPLNNGGNGLVVNQGDFLQIAYLGGQGIFQVVVGSGNVVSLLNGFNTLYSQVALTLAQFVAMYATPQLLIPAQGANTLIVLDQMVIKQIYGSAALVNGGGGNVLAQYGTTTHGGGIAASSLEEASDFTQTASTAYIFSGTSGNSSQVLYSVGVNVGVYLSVSGGVFSVGTGSSFLVDLKYTVLSSNS